MRKQFSASARFTIFAAALLAAASGASGQSLLNVSPGQLDFGSSNVGDRVTKQVFVVSQSESIQTVFVESSNQTFLPDPASIQPPFNDLLPYNIIFLPRGAGPVSSTITFYRVVSGQREDLATVRATGVGLSPFDVDPQEIDFGPLPVETRSEFRTIQVRPLQNVSDLQVNVRSIDPESFEVTPRQVNLSRDGVATVMVRFRPRRTGQTVSSITFSTPGVTLPVVVRGSGVGFGLDPAELVMPSTPTGCASTADILITPFDELDFLIGSQGPPFVVTPSSVVGNQPSTVNVSVASVPAGVTAGTIVLNAREGGQITQQRLVPVQVAGVEVQASPESVDFGSIPPGGPPLERTLRIVSSLPGSPIDVSLAVTSDNPAFVADADGGAVRVRFAPLAQGPVNGTLTVNVTPLADPTCGRTLRIPVSGTGGNPQLTLSPPIVAFGEVGVEQTASIAVLLTNRTASAFEGAVAVDNNAFLLARDDNLPDPQNVSLGPGESVRYNALFRPTRTGEFQGEATFLLRLVGGGASDNAILTLPLTGRGAPLTFSYELVPVGGGDPAALAAGQTIEAPVTAAGAASLLLVRARNISAEPAVIGQVAIDGEGFELSGQFSQISVGPGQAFDAPFRFAPARAGRSQATLSIGGAQFPLSGLGLLRGAAITGVPASITPGEQLDIGVTLQGLEPEGVEGSLEVVFEPLPALSNDPAVQFQTGGGTTPFDVRPGTGVPRFATQTPQVGLQTGSVAGVLRLQARFRADGEDVSPAAGVSASGTIAAGAPAILSARVEELTATGFTLIASGYSPTREAVAAVLELVPRDGLQLAESVISVDGAGAAFADHFAGAAQFGGLFELRAVVSLSGSPADVAAVLVRVSNSSGESEAFRTLVSP